MAEPDIDFGGCGGLIMFVLFAPVIIPIFVVIALVALVLWIIQFALERIADAAQETH